MIKKHIGLALLLMCASSVLFGNDWYGYDTPRVQNLRELYSRYGHIMPSESYPIREDQLYSYLMRLLLMVESREQALLEAVERWEDRRADISARIEQERSLSGSDDEPAEVMQVLVWPPPETELSPELQRAVELLEGSRPHGRLEEAQALRFHIEDELEYYQNRSAAGPRVDVLPAVNVQGFWNVPLNALNSREYTDTVRPFMQFSVRGRSPHGIGAALTAQIQRYRGSSREVSNLPIPDEQDSLPISPDAVTEAYLGVPFENGHVMAGRFPVRIGPGVDTLVIGSVTGNVDGVQAAVTLGDVRTTHLLLNGSRISAAGSSSSAVVHYAELSGGSWRVGIGGQTLFTQASVPARVLPLATWIEPQEHANTQLIADFSTGLFNGSEVYLQGGMQMHPAGWLEGDYPAAVIAGSRFYFRVPEGKTEARLEAGYTTPRWGSYPDTDLRFLYADRESVSPISSPFGPDALWGKTDVQIELSSGARFGFRLQLLRLREDADLDGSDYAAPPDGTYRLNGQLGIRFGYYYADVMNVEIEPGVDYRDSQLLPNLRLEAGFHGILN